MENNSKVYYVLSWTWGIIMTLIGVCVACVVIALGAKPQRHAGAIYFEIGKKGWGGISLGMFFFCSPGSSKSTKDHEFGHSLQNCLWGPLFPFVIGLPSLIRCAKFNYNYKKGIPNKENYDAIWFEGQATEWGEMTYADWH